MSVTMKVRRKDKLERKLLKMAPAAKETLRKATLKGAQDVQRLARQFAPFVTGELRESIQIELPIERKGLAARVGPTVFYGLFVEFGTRGGQSGTRTTDSRGRSRKVQRNHPGTPPRPFLLPAFRLERRRIKGRYTRAIRKAAKMVSRR